MRIAARRGADALVPAGIALGYERAAEHQNRANRLQRRESLVQSDHCK